MSVDYSKLTNNGVGFMHYHVGSTAWYDDVFAYSKTYVTSGMSGYAGVNLKAINNQIAIQYSDTIINNQIVTPNAGVAGVDYAEYVRFNGGRTDNGSNYYNGYVYYIY